MPSEYPPEISDQELRRSYWYVTHYKKIKQFFIVALGIAGGLLVLFGIWGMLQLNLFDVRQNEDMRQGLLRSLANSYQVPPVAEVVIESVGSRVAQEGFENGYAIVKNANDHWSVRANLVFSRGTSDVRIVPVFLLPSEKHSFVGLGIPVRQPSVSAALRDIQWSYITDREKVILDQSGKLQVGDVSFLSSDKTGVSRLIPVSKLKFSIINTTITNYWEVRIPIILRDRGVVVAASEVVLNSIDAGEKKSAEAVWFTPVVSADEFDIQPFVDIFDPTSVKLKTR